MTKRLQLSLGMTSNPRTWAILDESVKALSIDFLPTLLHPSELFWRQLKFGEFDVAEMSVSSMMMAVARGDDRFVGLPIFTTRRFFHAHILVRDTVSDPSDLAGKRVGIPEYQQTAALWIRGALKHEFGVEPREMEFWMERPAAFSHGSATGFVPPKDVVMNTIPLEKNMGSMMLSGELDAALFYLVDPNLIDRSKADLLADPGIRTLFPDPRAEGIRYFEKTGIYPINHMMVMRRDVAERHPWAVLNVLKAFVAANDAADRARMEHVRYHLETGAISPAVAESLRRPVVTHGVEPNRLTLETAARYSHEQGLTPRVVQIEELFAPSTLTF